jgi:hypothetical protein
MYLYTFRLAVTILFLAQTRYPGYLLLASEP